MRCTLGPWWIAFVGLAGCGKLGEILTEPRNTDGDEVYSSPTGDGSHYVAIFSEPETPPIAMERRWRKSAEKVCEGDYLVLADNAAERRRGGKVESRVHEGWVRCLSPDVTIEEADPDAPPSKTIADGSTKARNDLRDPTPRLSD